MPRHISLRLSAFASLGLLVGAPLCAQSGPTAQAPAQSAATDSSKKVWTNDDMANLRDDTSIPASSPSKTKAQANGSKPARPSGHGALWYHNQIAGLEAQVPPLNDQIAALQSAIDGKPTGDQQTSKRPLGVRIDSWTEQRDELAKKRDGILAHIDSLHDEARHNGVPASALP